MRATCSLLFALVVLTWTPTVLAYVDLALLPASQTTTEDAMVEMGLYAISDSAENQAVSGIQAVLTWNPAALELVGCEDNGPYDWLMSGLLDDSQADGLNNSLLDGDAFYQAAAQFTVPAEATPEGLLGTTLRFRALAQTGITHDVIEPELGAFSRTRVFKFGGVNEDVVGSLSGASVTITAPIPTVSAWGFVAMTLLVLAAGMLVLRRRHLPLAEPAVFSPD